MSRHKKPRCVSHMPNCTYFKPAGIPTYELDEVVLQLEEMEALRLKDLLGLEQVNCAVQMGISRPTFQRILVEARRKVAEVLVYGKSLRIEGGAYNFKQNQLVCPNCKILLAPENNGCPNCNGRLK
ncbi:MAG: DUF134 domain-containing protein [Syntrophomonadaceae bacterium]